MKRRLFTGLLVLLEMISTNVVSADEIKMKDIDTLSKKNKVIIINKNELSKYLHLKKKKTKVIHKSIVKKLSKEILLRNKIKNRNLIESLLLYKNFMVKNGKSKIIDEIILQKAKKLKNLDFDFFKKDFLQCNVKRLSNIIKDLNNEYK